MTRGYTYAWTALEAALADGPQHYAILAEAVYGEQTYHTKAAVLMLLRRMVRHGRLVRARRGWYALPGKTDGVQQATIDDLRRELRRRAQPIWWLSRVLAVPPPTIAFWFRQLRREGETVNARRGQPWDAITRVNGAPYPVNVYWLEAPRTPRREGTSDRTARRRRSAARS